MHDTDEDGLEDYYEVYISHTEPDDPDTDGDGFFDKYEIKLHTDPDSDGSVPDRAPETARFPHRRSATRAAAPFAQPPSAR